MPVFPFHRRHHRRHRQIERSGCSGTSADSEHLYSITHTTPTTTCSGPTTMQLHSTLGYQVEGNSPNRTRPLKKPSTHRCQSKLIELRRNRQLRWEVDVLKQAALIFARGRRDTGPTPPAAISAQCRMLGVPPLHLLLDDRSSRDGACGSDRRRRARDLARQPRTLRRQEDQGRLGKEGRHRVQEAHRRHHARTGHDERVHAPEDDSNRTGRGSSRRSSRTCWTASSTATPRIWRAILPMSASAEAGHTCACWSTWRTGASPAIPPGGPGTRGLVLAAFATLDFR